MTKNADAPEIIFFIIKKYQNASQKVEKTSFLYCVINILAKKTTSMWDLTNWTSNIFLMTSASHLPSHREENPLKRFIHLHVDKTTRTTPRLHTSVAKGCVWRLAAHVALQMGPIRIAYTSLAHKRGRLNLYKWSLSAEIKDLLNLKSTHGSSQSTSRSANQTKP